MEQILVELFGVSWANIIADSEQPSATGAVLGFLFELLNVAVAMVTVAAVVILLLSAIADTAQSGRIAGGRGAFWVPLRMVTAAALLMPVAKGYSILQVIILSLVVKSSLVLANNMAVEVARYVSTEFGTFTEPTAVRLQGVAEQMLYSTSCQAYYNTVEYAPSQGGKGQIQEQQSMVQYKGLVQHRLSFNGDQYSGQGESACGSYNVTCADTTAETLQHCEAQFAALIALKNSLAPMAARFVSGDVVDSQSLATAEIRYESDLAEALRNRLNAFQASSAVQQAGRSLVESVQTGGFALLGQWYMTLAAINQRTMQFSEATLDITPIDQSKAIDQNIGYFALHQRLQSQLRMKAQSIISSSTKLSEEAVRQRQMAGVLSSEGSLGDYLARFHASGVDGTSIKALFEFSENPLYALQELGNTMVTLTTGYWSSGTSTSSMALQTESDQALVKSLGQAAALLKQSGDKSGHEQLNVFATYIMILLFLSGLTLMYYIPAIPFILWVFALVSYLLLLLEALIAAPLWAAAHAMPAGRGFMSDASRRGYALLLNLALRPPLMVLGLISGGAVLLLASRFAMATFDIYSASLLESRVQISSLLSFTALFLVQVIILVGLVHKSFALIYQLSDRVIEWVSGHVRSAGEAQDESRASSAASAAQRSGEAALGRASYSSRSL